MAIKTYRVRPGMVFGSGDNKKTAGQLVRLDETLAAPFLDKLASLDTGDDLAGILPPPPPKELQNDLGAVIPDDMKLFPSGEQESDGDGESINLTENPILPPETEEAAGKEKSKRGRRAQGKE